MKEKMYDILSDLNEILKDIDAVVKVLEIQFDGVVEIYDSETARSVLRVHLHLLKGIQEDSNKLYNKIDKTILDMKYEVQAEHTQTLNR